MSRRTLEGYLEHIGDVGRASVFDEDRRGIESTSQSIIRALSTGVPRCHRCGRSHIFARRVIGTLSKTHASNNNLV